MDSVTEIHVDLLTEICKELTERITELEDRVETLESRDVD